MKLSKRAIAVFLLYIAFILYKCLTHQAFVTLDDDVYLQNFLYHADNGTYILSYPLSTLLARLYDQIPRIPWFSLTMFASILLVAAFLSYYASRIKERPLFIATLLFGLAYVDFLISNVSVTTLTVTLLALAVPALALRQPALFWSLVLAASFLRFPVVAAFAPLLIPAWWVLRRRKKRLRSKYIFPALLASLAFLNLASNLYYGKEYREWLQFRNAHQYFIDFHGKAAPGILNPFEEKLANSWIIQDEKLLPSSKVIEADRGKLTAVIEKLLSVSPRQIASKIYHTPLLALAIVLALLIASGRGYSPAQRAAAPLMIAAITALLLSRDVERVTVPLLLMVITTEILLMLGHRKRALSALALLLSALLVWRENIHFNRIHSPLHLAWAKEKEALMARHPDMQLERAIYFPTNYDREWLWSSVLQSRLFDESRWFTRRILPADWVSRHPLFYRLRHISHGGVTRRYADYHEWLLSDETAFIGGGEPNTDLTPKILALYDRIYPPAPGCRHAVRILDRSEHFALSQIVISCTPEEKGSGKTGF